MILLFGASIIRVKFNLYEMQDSHFKNSKISIFVLPVIMLICIVFKLFYIENY